MQSKPTETTQTKDELDLLFARAVAEKNYTHITQLIDNNVIDPNEIMDASKRLYPGGINLTGRLGRRGDHHTRCVFNFKFDEPSWHFEDELTIFRSGKQLQTVLHEAIAEGNEELVDVLLANTKTDPNQRSDAGYTPLHYAAIKGDEEVIKKLVLRGADPRSTWNGFTPADCLRIEEYYLTDPTYAAKISDIKELLSVKEGEQHLLLTLPRFLTKYLPKTIYSVLPKEMRSNCQERILSTMRAMRISDEVIYATDEGACHGVAYTAMLYLLSNKRDEHKTIIGLTELNYIWKAINTRYAEFFLEKMQSREQERFDIYQKVRSSIEGMNADDIATEVETLHASGIIDTNAFIKAHKLAEKKTLLLQKKFELEMASCFSKQALIELGFRNYMDTVELFHNIYRHPELHDKRYPITYQNAVAVLPLLISQELEQLGGISVPIKWTGVFLQNNAQDKNELELYFKSLNDRFINLEFPVTMQLSANTHAISVTYDPINNHWICVNANESSIVICTESASIAQWVYKALKFGHEGQETKGLPSAQPFLILVTDIYTAKVHEGHLRQQIERLKNDDVFNELFKVTPQKAALTDQGNLSWLHYARVLGQVDTVSSIFQEPVNSKKKMDRELYIYQAELVAKKDEKDANYYQLDHKQTYKLRVVVLRLANALSKEFETVDDTTKEIILVQYKFLMEVLKNTPIGQNATEDDVNIEQSILACVSRGAYQGREMQEFMTEEQSGINLIDHVVSNNPDRAKNMDDIFNQDKDLAIQIRQAIHMFEKPPADEESIKFLSDCLIVAADLAIANALKHIKGGVLKQAIEIVHKQSQDKGAVVNENIYTTLNAARAFGDSSEMMDHYKSNVVKPDDDGVDESHSKKIG